MYLPANSDSPRLLGLRMYIDLWPPHSSCPFSIAIVAFWFMLSINSAVGLHLHRHGQPCPSLPSSGSGLRRRQCSRVVIIQARLVRCRHRVDETRQRVRWVKFLRRRATQLLGTCPAPIRSGAWAISKTPTSGPRSPPAAVQNPAPVWPGRCCCFSGYWSFHVQWVRAPSCLQLYLLMLQGPGQMLGL